MKLKLGLRMVGLIMAMQMLLSFAPSMVLAEGESVMWETPDSPSVTYNMNFGWKFTKPSTTFPLASAASSVAKNGVQFYEVGYDDSDWETVSVPHAVNAEDSFDSLIADAGEAGIYRGFMFYRKNFVLPESDAGKKIFLEFEAVRQSVYLYVNGEMVGYYEAGVTAIGFDITNYVVPGEENLIAVATDNAATRGATFNTVETVPGNEPGDLSGWGYQWNTKDFNEVQGGITGNVLMYAKNDIYQTLPLYSNMKTMGNYITASDFDFREKTATINVDAEVRNESGSDAEITLEVAVVNYDGEVVAEFSNTETVAGATDAGVVYKTIIQDDVYEADPEPTTTETVDVTHIAASGTGENLRFWCPDDPYLYDVYCILKQDGEVIDLQKITTGFRKVEYDINNGGLLINETPIYLKGYAQRSTNEWATIGVANDWLSDIDMQLVRESNANFIRWMHVAPKPAAIRSGDKYGVVSVCPAGDKEGDVSDRTWDMRVEVMRDAIVYFRNSPSIIFWEAGNNQITAEHMQEMTDLRLELDPDGGRYMGCRTISSTDQIAAAEWVGTMINRHDASAKSSMAAIGKYIPIVETEYKRDESPRRVWDDYSPPDYDYVNKWLGASGSKTDGYDIWDQTQEDHILSLVSTGEGYSYFYNNRVGGTGNDYYSAAAMMVWSDSNMHGRNAGSENCRTSGRVDPIRVKKESFYAMQVMQADESMVHIIGHWNYPELTDETYLYYDKTWNGTYWEPNSTVLQRDPTNKTVYVLATQDTARLELYINDELVGTDKTADNNYVFAFYGIDVTQSGSIRAVAYNLRDEIIAEDEIVTAGEAATVRLTPITGPDGLIADGSDVMYYDVEVVDAQGNVCPLNYDLIKFEISGEGVFLGGYNSGKFGTESVIHKDYVYAECGINRVFIRSTDTAGAITLTATMEGMLPVTATVTSKALVLDGGLTTELQRSYDQGELPPPPEVEPLVALKPLASVFSAVFGVNTRLYTEAAKDTYSVTVNGEAITTGETPYKPDSSTGVLCEIRPVLDALIAAGAAVSYEYQTEGELPSYLSNFSNPLLTMIVGDNKYELACGDTTIVINEEKDKNLTNAEFYAVDGELVAELAPVLSYIDGVQIMLDTENKVLAITFEGGDAE